MKKGKRISRLIWFLLLILPSLAVMAQSFAWIEVKRLDTDQTYTPQYLPLVMPYELKMYAHQLVILEVHTLFYNDSPALQATAFLRNRSNSLDADLREKLLPDTNFVIAPKTRVDLYHYIVLDSLRAETGSVVHDLNLTVQIFGGLSASNHIDMVFHINPTDTQKYKLPVLIYDSQHFTPHISLNTYSPGTHNQIAWEGAEGVGDIQRIDQTAYYFNTKERQRLYRAAGGLYRSAGSDGDISARFDNLTDGEKYGFFVLATYTGSDTSLTFCSDIVYTVQDDMPPEKVAPPQANINGPGGITHITWNHVADPGGSGVASYQIYRTEDTGVESLVEHLPAAEQQWEDSIRAGITYYYRIRAVDEVGNIGEGERSAGIFWDGLGGEILYSDTIGTSNPYSAPALEVDYIKGTTDQLSVSLEAWVDSVRFVAVRDDTSYFENPPGRGMRFFESDAKFIGRTDSWTFDYGYSQMLGTEIDKNFVDNHIYYRRLYKKAVTPSSVHSQDLEPFAIAVDCLPPSDIRNLQAVSVISDPSFQKPHEGYSEWHMRVSWEHVRDNASGFRRYHVFRKIEGIDSDFRTIDLGIDTTVNLVEDPLTDVSVAFTNPMIHYRIAAEDNVGNIRPIGETRWEANDMALRGPHIGFVGPAEVDTIFTEQDEIEIAIDGPFLELSHVDSIAVSVNDVQEFHPPSGTLTIKLAQSEFSRIRVRHIYQGKRSSVWSNVLVTSPQNLRPARLSVERSTRFWNGDVHLRWNRSSLDRNTYRVYRGIPGDLALIAENIVSDADTVRWLDEFGWNELTESQGDSLMPFESYWYGVQAYNPLDPADTTRMSALLQTHCDLPGGIDSSQTDLVNDPNKVTIFWTRSSRTLAGPGHITYIRRSTDALDNAVVMDTVVNKTTYTDTSIIPGHNYIYQVMEKPDLIAGEPNREGLTTSWSVPWTVSVMLLEPFWVQVQPKGKVYLKWKPDSLLLKNIDVQSYILIRKRLIDETQKIYTFQADDTTFMDSEQLIHDNEYVYKMLARDSLNHVVAVNSDTIKCDTGAVFVPEILHITRDPMTCPVRFFNRDDSILVKWRWRESDQKTTADNTRGAVRITVQVSVASGFPDDTQRTISESMNVTASDTMLVVALPSLVSNNNNKIWFRIAGFDRFDNPEPPVWSNEFFQQKTAIYDPFDPYAVQDLILNSVRAYDCVSDTVIADMAWTGQGVQWNERSPEETQFNVHGFFLVRTCSTSVDTVAFIQRSETGAYSYADTASNHESMWKIVTADCAGNVSAGDPMGNQNFLKTPRPPIPDSLEHCMVDPDDVYDVPVQYFFEIAMDSSHYYRAYEMDDTLLVDRILSRSGWSTRNEYSDTTGWAEIVKNHTWFRIKVRRSPNWESGWSQPALFDTAKAGKYQGRYYQEGIPVAFKMEQNFPNPFNNSTQIQYQLPASGQVNLKLYNINGQLVRVLVDKTCEAGYHAVDWDGRDSRGKGVATGIYLLRISIRSAKGEMLYNRKIKMTLLH